MQKNIILSIATCSCMLLSIQAFAITTFCQPGNGWNSELNSCSPCVAGSASAYGVSCNACGAGTYAGQASSSCNFCPNGTTSKIGSISVDDCTACPEGQIVVNGECTNNTSTNNINNPTSGTTGSSGGGENTLPSTPPLGNGGPVYNQVSFGGGGLRRNGIKKITTQKIIKVIKKKKLSSKK